MRFIAVDDEKIMLDEISEILHHVRPDDEILTFSSSLPALETVKSQKIDVAFLDIQMGKITGIDLAVQIKKLQPDIHIIFVTGYSEYAVQAYRIHATGYLLKPISEEDIIRELTFIYDDYNEKKFRVQTFGGFELFVDGVPVKFERSKAKELLAFLVDRKGSAVTTAEAYTVLFEDADNSVSGKAYFRNIVRSLKTTLKNAGADRILLRDFNRLAIVPEVLDCDYYHFLEGDPVAINHFRDNYLPQYSWAEIQNASLHFSK